MKTDLPRRFFTSAKWNSIINIFIIIINVGQSVILARLLPVEIFGLVAGAASIVLIANAFLDFGFTNAFVYRSTETEDLDHIASVHFTLQLLISIFWTLLMLSVGVILSNFREDRFITAFFVITLSKTALSFMSTPNAILFRFSYHKRRAIIRLIDALFSLIIAIIFASFGYYIWALLSSYIVTAVVNLVFLYFWKPFWRPRFNCSAITIKYLLKYGGKNLIGQLIANALDRVDELWINLFIGNQPLGFYSKAYILAGYPGSLLASSIGNITLGSFAELADNKKALSDAFDKTISFLIRASFLLGGLLVLIAPELIMFFLGPKWLPMLLVFRIMLPYTLLDPILITIFYLFNAVGEPEKIINVRAIQLGFLIISIAIFANFFGIEGVAISVDLMMVLGFTIVFLYSRKYVDFSIKSLLFAPSIALMISLGLSFFLGNILNNFPILLSGTIKSITYFAIFAFLLFVFDRKNLEKYLIMGKKYFLNEMDPKN